MVQDLAVIRACELPEGALLRKYLSDGAYADCYATEVAGHISRAKFIEAFYTTRLFKLERLVLSLLAARPCTDEQVRQLAAGNRTSLAAWVVEDRAENQLLLSDFTGRTRTWLMNRPSPDLTSTELFFGSAVIPVVNERTGKAALGVSFRALLGFHKLYSRALLRAAVNRLAQTRSDRQ